MKTHLLYAIVLGLAGTASAATAQDSDTFLAQTTIPGFCANISAQPAPLEVDELSDSEGRVVSTFTGTTSFSVPAYYCNAPATITLKATPLKQTQGSTITNPNAFTDLVHYRANLTWDNVSGSVESTVVAGADIAAAEANYGDLTVSISNPNTIDNRRPIAGDYEGAVTLTVTLQ